MEGNLCMEKKQLVLTSRKLFCLVTRPFLPQDFDHLLNTKLSEVGKTWAGVQTLTGWFTTVQNTSTEEERN